MYYSAFLALISVAVLVYDIIFGKSSSDLIFPSVIGACVFGGVTYYMWDTRCPRCKRSFAKKEKIEWREDLGVKKEAYQYHSKVYRYSDGTTEDVPGSEKTIMRDKKYDRHYYICKFCEHGSDKEWKEDKGQWLGENPKPQYIHKKGSAMNFSLEDERESSRKRRVPIRMSVKKEVFERAENVCQHCGHSFGLDIHHIDENPSNNRMSNLILLCANCHRQVGSISKIALKNEALKPYKKAKTINVYKQS